jgi:hypothetical protein
MKDISSWHLMLVMAAAVLMAACAPAPQQSAAERQACGPHPNPDQQTALSYDGSRWKVVFVHEYKNDTGATDEIKVSLEKPGNVIQCFVRQESNNRFLHTMALDGQHKFDPGKPVVLKLVPGCQDQDPTNTARANKFCDYMTVEPDPDAPSEASQTPTPQLSIIQTAPESRPAQTSGQLTTESAQRALNRWGGAAGSIMVLGIRETPSENSATADLRFDNYKVKTRALMGGVQERTYSGSGKAEFVHYNDSRWVLSKVVLGQGFSSVWWENLNIEAK